MPYTRHLVQEKMKKLILSFVTFSRVLVITHDFQEKVINPDFQILFKQISDIITGVEYPPAPITRSKYNISLQSNLGIFVETLQKHLDGGANDIYVISVQTPQLEDWSFPLGHIHRASQGEAGEK